MSFHKELLKGCIEPLMLAILHERDKYGYELAKEIGERSEDGFVLKDGTLYPALKRLEQDGLVESYWGDSEAGARRRYYRLTEPGRRAYREWLGEWDRFVRSVNSVLGVGG